MPSMMASKNLHLNCQTAWQKPNQSTQRNVQKTTSFYEPRGGHDAAAKTYASCKFNKKAQTTKRKQQITDSGFWCFFDSWAPSAGLACGAQRSRSKRKHNYCALSSQNKFVEKCCDTRFSNFIWGRYRITFAHAHIIHWISFRYRRDRRFLCVRKQTFCLQ
jgi:hypothetical protein